ncbi:MAG: hypothetical protein HYT36_01580 [Candidatus Staskawiczbacteria bacterium]|nr:hypothetical protein [Candidatus Staskawiczbacteria bacterium]
MLEDSDIEKLTQFLATKEDFNNLSFRMLPQEEFKVFKKEIKTDINDLKELVRALVISVDKLVKAIDDLRQEFITVASRVNLRVDTHEKWFQQIAEKLGTKL